MTSERIAGVPLLKASLKPWPNIWRVGLVGVGLPFHYGRANVTKERGVSVPDLDHADVDQGASPRRRGAEAILDAMLGDGVGGASRHLGSQRR